MESETEYSYEQKIVERQRRLSEILGVPGHEENVVKDIIEEIKPVVDRYWINPNGSLMAVIRGKSDSAILLDAHTDEIGFIISHITDKGFSYFTLLGGFDERILLGQSVIIQNENNKRIFGVIGALPPHILSAEERKKPIAADRLFMDFGFLSREEAENNSVNIGTVGTLYSGFQELPGGRLKGKAFDDRSGCNILVQTALNIKGKDLPYTVCFSWSSQEEVGLRGARTAAFDLSKKYNIEMAVACENTTAAAVPGVPPQKSPSILGMGPAITIMDSGLISSKKVRERLINVAKENKIPYQMKKPLRAGGTDAGAISITRSGISSGVVSVPARYIHSPCTIIDKKDLIAAVDLITAFVLDPSKI